MKQTTPQIQLEVGKYYINADGEKVGPIQTSFHGGFFFKESLGSFYSNGKSTRCLDPDIVAEWIDEPRNDRKISDPALAAIIQCYLSGHNITMTPATTRVSGTIELDAEGKPIMDTWEADQ